MMDKVQKAELLSRIKEHFNLDHLLFLDFETYYKSRANNGSKSYSLKGMTYPEYIFDERFQVTGLGFAFDLDDWSYIHRPNDVEATMELIKAHRAKGDRIGVVAHNCQFDASIMSWLYGVTFDHYFCTQLIENLMYPTGSATLAATAERVFPDDKRMRKGKELANYDGVRYEDIPEADQNPNNPDTLAWYCVNDNELLREIFFKRMSEGTPQGEIDLMHITLRGCIEPQFLADDEVLEEIIVSSDEAMKQKVIRAIRFCHEEGMEMVDKGSFSSNQKYSSLLKSFGVTVPLKMSKTTFQMTSALGKNDPEYIKLQINKPELEPLYTAREAVKSTIAKSRAERMLACKQLFSGHGFIKADLPFFLNYYGARNTGRWSGGEKLNQQNLPRYNRDSEGKPVIDDKAHRLSMLAPESMVIVVNDLSNIELRVNLWFCEQHDILDKFRQDPDFDMYSDLASDIYGFKVNKKTHKDERQVGKAGALGLGYAMSWYGFQQYLAGGPLGMEPMFVSDRFAKEVKQAYDLKHYAIAAMWQFIDRSVLPILWQGGEIAFGPGNCVRATKDKIILPSGRVLHYPNTSCKGEETQYGLRMQYSCDSSKLDRFKRPIRRSLHKGLIIENIIQALARDVLAMQMVAVEKALQEADMGWVAGSVHDEILGMVIEARAQEGLELMQAKMKIPPAWCHDIPLASEGGYAREYSK